MAFIHGKGTVITVDANDLSAYTSESSLDKGADIEDVTCYGKNDHCYAGGLGDASGSMSGIYASGATGPRAVLDPLIGTTVTLIRQPEGAGSTLPQDSCSIIPTKYAETNPVAGMIKWSCDFQVTDAVDTTAQT